MGEKASLTDQIYNKMKDMLLYGSLKPGEILTVGEIANKFNISRTPVREAFSVLKQDGLLDVLPHKGYLVSRIDMNELGDLFALRMILETGAAELAAKNASDEMLGHLEQIAMVEFDKDGPNDEIFFMKTNFNFHTFAAKTSKNEKLANLIANNLNLMQRVLFWDTKNSSLYAMQQEHLQFVELLKKRDAVQAKKFMVAHIEASRSRIFAKSYHF